MKIEELYDLFESQRVAGSDRLRDSNEFVSDLQLLDFLRQIGGGLFFEGSLIIYGHSSASGTDLKSVNEKLKFLYPDELKECMAFSCDIFGNQYLFNHKSITLFYIESTESEFIATDFNQWMLKITEDTDYYTGLPTLKEWRESNGTLAETERLYPVKPFVAGGDYSLSNIRPMNFFRLLEYSATIAHYIKDLPDGTPIDFKITD